jgi:hypothetical protein
VLVTREEGYALAMRGVSVASEASSGDDIWYT